MNGREWKFETDNIPLHDDAKVVIERTGSKVNRVLVDGHVVWPPETTKDHEEDFDDTTKLLILADGCSEIVYGGDRGWEQVDFNNFVERVRDFLKAGLKYKRSQLVDSIEHIGGTTHILKHTEKSLQPSMCCYNGYVICQGCKDLRMDQKSTCATCRGTMMVPCRTCSTERFV